jgi:prevent-host-death family protein
METISTHEAKTHLSRFLARVELGEEIVIARSGKPVARLVPLHVPQQTRQWGTEAGKITVPDDFNTLDTAMLQAFEGEA